MTKYGFNIRTRGGHKVDNIVIMAQDYAQAERRLRQMYVQCEILAHAETMKEAKRNPYETASVTNIAARRDAVRKSGTQ